MGLIFPAALLKKLLITYSATALLLFLVEYFFAAKRTPFRRAEWKLDLFYLFFLATAVVLLVQLTSRALQLLPWQMLPGFAAARAAVSSQPLWLQSSIAFLLLDFCAYWQHRLAHHRLLWPLHAIHHSSRHIDWLSGSRFHPMDLMLKRAILSVPVLLLGFSSAAVATFIYAVIFFNYLTHANVPWTYGPAGGWVVSPVFHRWHHAIAPGLPHRNFGGVLSVWDRLFGTAYFAPATEECEVGTATPVPARFVGQMFFPFRF